MSTDVTIDLFYDGIKDIRKLKEIHPNINIIHNQSDSISLTFEISEHGLSEQNMIELHKKLL